MSVVLAHRKLCNVINPILLASSPTKTLSKKHNEKNTDKFLTYRWSIRSKYY